MFLFLFSLIIALSHNTLCATFKQAIRWQGKPKCAIFFFFFDKLYIFSTTHGGKPPIYAMQILSWILYYKFKLDSGDLGGWLIGAVRSFHTAEYGRAVQLLKVQ